ncbi:MAG TPA: cytochrome P450 [Pseudonocardiaceae bacterium]|jgi:cytochrome P450|nr:cytochrome P450 [Pseudonocardiaceae bacterium]
MTLGQDLKAGLTMFGWRAGLRAQAALGDPLAKVLSRGPNRSPYPLYELAREQGELSRSKLGVHVTASHELANVILRDSRFGVQGAAGQSRDEWQAGSADEAADRKPHNPIDESFLSLDPPRHTRLRRLVAPWFTPRALRERSDRIERVVTRFLDELADRDEFDLIGDFAARVPIQVICDLLGVPDSDYSRFLRWGADVALSLDSTWTLGQYRQLQRSLGEMNDFFTRLLAQRRREPADDIVSDLVRAEAAGGDPVTETDLLATSELLLVAGFETTVNLIGNGALELLHNGDARAWLAEHPDRLGDLVEEVLRHDPPVQHTMRIAHEPVTLAGVTLPTDGGVVLLLGGANRDPKVFDRPGEFDPTRQNNREHVAFSAGIHYCLGAGLARIEAGVALRALFERYPSLRAGRPVRRRTRNIHGVLRLPVSGRAHTVAGLGA